MNMLVWASENSIPANYLIIRGDRDRFSFTIKLLHTRAFNILLEPPPNGYSLQSLLSGRPPTSEALSSSSASTGPYKGMVYWMAKNSVWWDVDKCPIPAKCDPSLIARNIKLALAEERYKGDVTITAYANTEAISNSDLQALENSGIPVHHVPPGGKGGIKTEIKSDMMAWMRQNCPPANYVLISDKAEAFSVIFERKDSWGFNHLMLPSDDKDPHTLLTREPPNRKRPAS